MGFPVLNLKIVARRYATSWFVVDAIASLPLDWFMGEEAPPWVQGLQLLKTLRLLRVRRLLSTWSQLTATGPMQVMVILMTWLLVAHWFGCIWCTLHPCRSNQLCYVMLCYVML